MKEIAALIACANKAAKEALSLAAIEKVRVDFLGKKGQLTEKLRCLKALFTLSRLLFRRNHHDHLSPLKPRLLINYTGTCYIVFDTI